MGDLALDLDESFGGGRLTAGDPTAGFKLEVDETKFEVRNGTFPLRNCERLSRTASRP